MVRGEPGLDVSTLVRGVLANEPRRTASRLQHRLAATLTGMRPVSVMDTAVDAYGRLFGTLAGSDAHQAIGNESKTLDALSALGVEVLIEFLDERYGIASGASSFGRRFLTVPGLPTDPPTVLVLDPSMPDVSYSRRITDDLDVDPQGLVAAFERLRPFVRDLVDERLLGLLYGADARTVLEMLWVSLPEVVLSRRPRMVPLSVSIPHLEIRCGAERSSAGVFCRDEDGVLGVTGCLHGTGSAGTPVTVGGLVSSVKRVDVVQDIVFIPLGGAFVLPQLRGRAGVRQRPAPSEAEPVSFEGAGSAKLVSTRVKSHDAGILRSRKTLQLKVQTPADANPGDSGSALVDEDDRVVAFGFERTGYGEFPELTDWIWAANALGSLGLTPI